MSGIWHPISNKDDLKQKFELSGDVASVDILNDRYPGASNGFDFKESRSVHLMIL
jgi:RNA recognition motif-containing protein